MPEVKPIARIHSPFMTKFGIPRQSGVAEAVGAEIVPDSTPTDCHSVVFGSVARAENEVFCEESEAVVSKLLLYVEWLKLVIHTFFFAVS